MSSTRTHSRASHNSSSQPSDRSDRSQSSSSGRTRTRTDAYTSDYSDDFDMKSEGPQSPRTATPTKKAPKPRKRYNSNRSTVDLHSSYGAYGNLRKKPAAKLFRQSHSAPKPKGSTNSKKNSVAKHVLTAKQQEVNELQNRLFNAKQKLELAEKENKLLKTLQHRQDKAIRKFENAENDLPRLISRNFEDQRFLKTKLRKTQETKRALELKLNENNEEIQKMEGVLKRLKKMVYDKNLGERSELSKQLSDAGNNLSMSESKIKELEKKLDLTISNCTRHLNSERQKHKETRDRMDKLHEEYLMTDTKLKEKERALNVSNIYTMRKRGTSEKALVPVKATPRKKEISSATQTDLALSYEPKVEEEKSTKDEEAFVSKFNTSPALNRLHSDASKTVPKKRDQKTSVFLTAGFESPLSSPNSSFISENGPNHHSTPRTVRKQNEKEDDFSDTLQHTEEEIRKLQIVLKQKADLLSKIQEIDGLNSPESLPHLSSNEVKQEDPKTVKLSSKSKAERVQSLLGNGDSETMTDIRFLKSTNAPVDEIPKKPEREISFGGYAPTVGATPARRKTTVTKSIPKPVTPTRDSEEPLFDLTSGKQNKKSDLLAQLFGNQDVLAGGSG